MAIKRMQRLQSLHQEINRENAIKRQVFDQKSLISAVFERIKIFDKNDYFRSKIKAFDRLHETEKPYFDKDREKRLIPDRFVPNLKEAETEILKIEENVQIITKTKTEDTNNLRFETPRYETIAKNCTEATNSFNKQLQDLTSIKAKENSFWTNEETKEYLASDKDSFIVFNIEFDKNLVNYKDKLKKSWKGSKLHIKTKGFMVTTCFLLLTALICLVLLIVFNFA
ncbi:hypothetical protein [Spiroplasma clarkii]|uniref:Uncharacterized protein n=1 Tax=Spiroplasma clarkii TaxID=2139 RepID=A0A2K8KJ90_9MOLU|nr:hypothetical protein [Spiroplasma clarkii]ATX71362.1 hypothetical protein SCLAR_v1c10620 [Spiroplasma clarkii]